MKKIFIILILSILSIAKSDNICIDVKKDAELMMSRFQNKNDICGIYLSNKHFIIDMMNDIKNYKKMDNIDIKRKYIEEFSNKWYKICLKKN